MFENSAALSLKRCPARQRAEAEPERKAELQHELLQQALIAEHVQAVAGVARAELARRIGSLVDRELAMLRAHAAAPVAGPARAELLRRHPQLTPMMNQSIAAAVRAFCEEDGGWIDNGYRTADFHSPKAEAKYGQVGLWDVSEVRSMDSLFNRCVNFNEDVSAWDVGRAEFLSMMFASASSFNQSLGAWAVRPGANARGLRVQRRHRLRRMGERAVVRTRPRWSGTYVPVIGRRETRAAAAEGGGSGGRGARETHTPDCVAQHKLAFVEPLSPILLHNIGRQASVL